MLALAEVLDRDGRVRRSLPVTSWPLRLGRAIDNDLVLDDPHVGPHHALVEPGAAGGLEVVALPGINGLQLGRRRIAPGGRAALEGADGTFGIGQTRVRLRLPGEALAPERPLARAGALWPALGAALAFWLWVLVDHAVELDPGSRPSEWIAPLVAVPGALLVWTTLWALASKLFQHRLDFVAHLRIACLGALAIEVAAFVLPWCSALSGWALPSRLAGGVSLLLVLWVVMAHARVVLPLQRRALAVLASAAAMAGGALLLTLNQQRHDRWFAELYTSTLPPPWLMWTPRVSPGQFMDEAKDLQPRLQEAVREAEAKRRDTADDDEI